MGPIRPGRQRRHAFEALEILDEVVAAINERPAQQRVAFVEGLCRQQLDALVPRTELRPRWRHPLLEHVLIPSLNDLIALGRADALRWRGVLRLTGALSPRLDELIGTTPQGDLRTAVVRCSADHRASRWLRWSLATRLEYVMHELPSGLLARPDEVIQECVEIEQLSNALGDREGWSEILSFWRVHANGYRTYLAERAQDPAITYSDYVADHGLPLREPTLPAF